MPQYVSLEQQGFYRPFEALGNALTKVLTLRQQGIENEMAQKRLGLETAREGRAAQAEGLKIDQEKRANLLQNTDADIEQHFQPTEEDKKLVPGAQGPGIIRNRPRVTSPQENGVAAMTGLPAATTEPYWHPVDPQADILSQPPEVRGKLAKKFADAATAAKIPISTDDIVRAIRGQQVTKYGPPIHGTVTKRTVKDPATGEEITSEDMYGPGGTGGPSQSGSIYAPHNAETGAAPSDNPTPASSQPAGASTAASPSTPAQPDDSDEPFTPLSREERMKERASRKEQWSKTASDYYKAQQQLSVLEQQINPVTGEGTVKGHGQSMQDASLILNFVHAVLPGFRIGPDAMKEDEYQGLLKKWEDKLQKAKSGSGMTNEDRLELLHIASNATHGYALGALKEGREHQRWSRAYFGGNPNAVFSASDLATEPQPAAHSGSNTVAGTGAHVGDGTIPATSGSTVKKDLPFYHSVAEANAAVAANPGLKQSGVNIWDDKLKKYRYVPWTQKPAPAAGPVH